MFCSCLFWLDLCELLQILCLYYSLCIPLQPHTTSQSECRLLWLIVHRLNAITAFFHKFPKSKTKTIHTWYKIVWLKPDIPLEMLFLFVDLNTCSAPLNVSERYGPEPIQIISWVLPLRWPASKVTIFGREVDIVWWSVDAKYLKYLVSHSTFNKIVVQVQLNHHKYASLHHIGSRKLVSCRCVAILQKTRWITESHSGIPWCVELCKAYAFMFIWN